jgi:hypothetical protein
MNTCTIEIKEKEYTLCLNRDAIRLAEGMGFNMAEMEQGIKILTHTEILWRAGFYENHKEVNDSLSLKLKESYQAEGGDVGEVVAFLIQEYMGFLTALTNGKSEKKAKIVRV